MSSASELKAITDYISDYYSKLSAYLDGSSSECPSFEDYNELLSYGALLNDAIQSVDAGADFSTGALVDTIYYCEAISREFSIRARRKAFYYDAAVPELALASEQFTDLYGRYLNFIRGKSPERRYE